jgi:SAM-dependent methyltransferase
MEEWPIEHKRQILEVIRELNLPAKGEALDFGCGNGVFTELIRQALPAWKVYGTDISRHAIGNAQIRYPNCTFFEVDSPAFAHITFDFVFTHHVFEHVFNLSEVFNQMDGYLKPESAMLHCLPCGNEGSYEHNICLLRRDGIDIKLDNRFFFEEPGHVRRLTTDMFSRLCYTKGFKLHKEFYSNHYLGAISWITNNNPKFVLMFSDAHQAINKDARRRLHHERIYLLVIAALRQPARIVTQLFNKRNKHLKHYILLMMGLPFYGLSRPIDIYWRRQAVEEWDTRKCERNGSEMYLCFKRS